MKYAFPIIDHIDDIENFRADGVIHDAFKCGTRRNGTIVYDYIYMTNDVFPPIDATPFAAFARELRGLTFDAKTGALLSRPYQKFFNAGEREETGVERLPLTDPHVVMEKLDGSMIHAFIQPDGAIAFSTRWGVTPIAQAALAFYEAHDASGAGRAAMREIIDGGHTPIFEWTSPDYIIVVRHDEPALTLTAVRDRRTGVFAHHRELSHHARAMLLPNVKLFDPVSDWDSFARRAVAETEGEGYVLRFDDGHMLKIKNMLYARVHRFKVDLALPKNAAEILLDGGLDDMLPYLSPREQTQLSAYREDFMAALRRQADRVSEAIARAKGEITIDDPRERQKIFWQDYAAPLGPALSRCANDVWLDRENPMEAVMGYARKRTTTGARFEQLTEMMELPKLAFGFDGDQ